MPENKSPVVLLLGLGGNVTQGVLKAVRAGFPSARTIGACVSAEAAGLYFCDKAYVSPYANDPAFVPWLIEVCDEEGAAIVLSGVEEVLESIAANRSTLEERVHSKFVVCSPEQLRIGRDKLATCLWLKEHGFAYPRFCLPEDKEDLLRLADETDCRIIAKPRLGKGSQGVIRVRSREELKALESLPDYIAEEEIGAPDKEYTVGCYYARNGGIHIIIFHRRLTAGTTSAAQVCENAAIERYARDICAAFAPEGPLNLQMRLKDDGEPVCFEMNVRFSGTTPMRAHFGFEDAKAAILEYVYNESADSCFAPRRGLALRFWDELYIEGDAAEKLAARGNLDNPKKWAEASPILLPARRP